MVNRISFNPLNLLRRYIEWCGPKSTVFQILLVLWTEIIGALVILTIWACLRGYHQSPNPYMIVDGRLVKTANFEAAQSITNLAGAWVFVAVAFLIAAVVTRRKHSDVTTGDSAYPVPSAGPEPPPVFRHPSPPPPAYRFPRAVAPPPVQTTPRRTNLA